METVLLWTAYPQQKILMIFSTLCTAVQFPVVAAGAALIAAGALAATGTITPVGVAVGGGAAVAAAGGGMMVAEEMCLGKDG